MRKAEVETRAWREPTCAFSLPVHVPSMISPEEREYLHWLTRYRWTGRGAVVEVGPWLGGSTLCLASGMRESGHNRPYGLHVIDNFVWQEFMTSRASLLLEPGESFRAAFEENTRDFKEMIVCHEATLPDDPLQDDVSTHLITGRPSHDLDSPLDIPGPIEILFIDGAKSWRGMHSLLTQLRAGLVPSVTLLVCQDYKCWDAYWVPMMVARLKEYLRPVHNVLRGGTVTFQLEREIPSELLSEIPALGGEMDLEESVRAIRAAAAELAEWADRAGAAAVGLGEVCLLSHRRQPEAAIGAFHRSSATWPRMRGAEPLERAHRYLERVTSRRIALPFALSTTLLLRGAARRVLHGLRSKRRGHRPGRAAQSS